MATVFVGRLVRDPQVYTVNGRNKTLFTLAVERNYTDKQGNYEVDYPPISAWNGLGEICAKHLAKGRMVSVECHYRSYVTEKNGQKEYGHEFVADNVKFLDSPNKNGQQNNGGQNGQPNYTNQNQVAPQQRQQPNQAQNYQPRNQQPQQNSQQNYQPQNNQNGQQVNQQQNPNWNNNQQNGNVDAPF